MDETVLRRGVTWRLSVSPEVLTEYAGARLRPYYTDPVAMLRTQELARDRFFRLYGVDVTHPHVAVPAYIGAAALGAEIVYPEDSSPMLANQGRVLPDARSVLQLAAADPEEDPAFDWMLSVREHIESETGLKVGVPSGQEGPLTTAVLLRGQSFFLDLYEEPRAAHHLLEVATDTYLRYVRRARGLSGQSGGGVGIADDFAGLVSPAMWPEFVVPYWQRIFESLGPGPRSVHSELLRVEHLPFLKELGVDHFDPGADQYLTGPLIRRHCDIPFTRYFLPIDDLILTDPARIKRRYSEEVLGGASHIDADVSGRGIPAENIRAFVDVARQYE